MLSRLLLLCLMLTSCTTVRDYVDDFFRDERLKPNPNLLYRYDMKLIVNGQQGEGVMVVRAADTYNIEVEAKQKLDLFTIRSCHREIPLEGIGGERYGIFGQKRRNVKISFTPNDKELLDCPLELAGYSKDTGKHSFGFIDFEHAKDTLSAMVSCNGSKSNFNGHSVCQSRFGLIQEVSFATEVWASASEKCPLGEQGEIMQRTKGKTFTFILPKGLCNYIFKEVEGSKRTHMMGTVGYEDIFVRGFEE